MSVLSREAAGKVVAAVHAPVTRSTVKRIPVLPLLVQSEQILITQRYKVSKLLLLDYLLLIKDR